MGFTLKQKLIYTLVSVVLFLFIIEGSTRLLFFIKRDPLQPFFYGSDEFYRFCCQDKQEIKRRQIFYSVQQNKVDKTAYDLSKGDVIRGKYVTFEKPKNTIRILVHGASSVFSVTTQAENAFPEKLHRLLNKNLNSEKKFEVVNMGYPGASSKEIYLKHQKKGFKFEHDIEIFYFLHNDFLLPVRKKFMSKNTSYLYRINHIFYRLSAFYTFLSHLFYPESDFKILYEQYFHHLHAMIDACKKRNIFVFIVKQPIEFSLISTSEGSYREFMTLYKRALSEIDDLKNRNYVSVIDAVTPFFHATTHLQRLKYFQDSVHLTERGNQKIAEIIYDVFADQIRFR